MESLENKDNVNTKTNIKNPETAHESNIQNNEISEYNWFWKANKDPFNKKEEPEWAPYDIAVSHKIEENFAKGITFFEIEIGNDIYCVDLKKNIQFLKKDSYRCRFIIRATGKDNIHVFRINRFSGIIDSSTYKNNLLKNHHKEENFQVKIKVFELFGYPKKHDSKSFMFRKSNLLFNTDICISGSIHKELINRFFGKLILEDKDDLLKHLKKEIFEEAERLEIIKNEGNKLDCLNTLKNSDFMGQASVYSNILESKNRNLTLEEKLIQLYTAEGFIVYSINSVLRNLTLSNSKLPLYFCLLQASIDIVSKKYNPKYASKSVEKIEEVDYYVFFRGAQIPENTIQEDITSLNEKTGIFRVYNEFLSTTYVKDVAFGFLFDDVKENHVRVFYKFLIEKGIADKIPNLLCFVEKISLLPQEKEVLLSSSTIFQSTNILKMNSKEGSYFEIASKFISNGFNKYDFIKYTSLQNINLERNEIGDEGAKSIADALKINTSLKEINLRDNKIGNEGAKSIADALKTNTSLQNIDLRSNQIGAEGAKSIADALKTNTSLVYIDLSCYQIGDEGAKSIADALKTKTSLQYIYLHYNKIGDEGAKSIADALKTNTSLVYIDLSCNKIGDEGTRSIAEALKTNTSLQKIDLIRNEIGDEGAKSIADALKTNTSLKEINMQCNQIGYEGAKSIGTNTSLQKIDLYDRIVEEAKRILDALKTNTSLQNIDLHYNKIGDEVRKELGSDKRIKF